MSILRTLLLCLVVISLNMGSIAYAGMPCCSHQKQQEASHTANTDMPCHEAQQDNSKQASMDCSGCQCQHCIPLNVITSDVTISLNEMTFTHPTIQAERMISHTVSYIAPPPKA